VNSVPRMRTIAAAFAELKVADNDTGMTQCALRRLVNEGRISSRRIGRKILINVDDVIEYLSTGDVQQKDLMEEYGRIRRIRE